MVYMFRKTTFFNLQWCYECLEKQKSYLDRLILNCIPIFIRDIIRQMIKVTYYSNFTDKGKRQIVKKFLCRFKWNYTYKNSSQDS